MGFINLVLNAIKGNTFEPLATVSLKALTFKVLFLVAVTWAKRVSELGSLPVSSSLCVFHKDRVVWQPDLEFMPW